MLNAWVRKHIAIKRALGITVLCSFLVTSSLVDAGAAVTGGGMFGGAPEASTLGTFPEIDMDTFTIPGHLGEVRYTHKGTSDKVIIHIQDAHCNEFAQHKISGIIDYLNKEYGIDMVNLEGGVGDYDLSVFTAISEESIRREVADHFVKKGEINDHPH